MTSGAQHARQQQYIYRNTAVELGPGRYAWTGYSIEPVIRRDQEPTRASEGKIARKVEMPKKKGTPGMAPKHPPADQLPQTKGAYKFDHVIPNPTGQSFVVVAICQGGYCGGRVRKFGPSAWCKPNDPLKACNTCAQVVRAAERRAWRARRKAAGLRLINVMPGGDA